MSGILYRANMELKLLSALLEALLVEPSYFQLICSSLELLVGQTIKFASLTTGETTE